MIDYQLAMAAADFDDTLHQACRQVHLTGILHLPFQPNLTFMHGNHKPVDIQVT